LRNQQQQRHAHQDEGKNPIGKRDLVYASVCKRVANVRVAEEDAAIDNKGYLEQDKEGLTRQYPLLSIGSIREEHDANGTKCLDAYVVVHQVADRVSAYGGFFQTDTS